MASVAELTRSFFSEIDTVEIREDPNRLHVKCSGREKGILTAVLRLPRGTPPAKRKEPGPQAQELKRAVEKLSSYSLQASESAGEALATSLGGKP